MESLEEAEARHDFGRTCNRDPELKMSETRQAPQATLFAATSVQDDADRRLRLTGEFDLAGVDAAQAVLDDLLQGCDAALVIDLSELTFMDSTGLRFLLSAQSRCAEADLPLLLRQGGPPIQRLLAMTGMDAVFAFER